MSHFVHTVTSFIAAHPHFAYLAVLLLAFSESLPVVGAVVPGSGIIIALAALIPGGTLHFWPMLGAAVLGAIIGDGFSFWLGRRYHREILTRWPLNRQPGLVALSESFFARHGDKSVFIARFTPGVRAVVPLFAGILGMSATRFYTANVLSALIWAPSHVLSGVLAGASLGYFGAAAEPLAILAVLLLAVGWLLYRLLRLAIGWGYPRIERRIEAVRGWAENRTGRLAGALAALLDPAKPQVRGLALLGLLLAGAAWLFLAILEDVVNGDPLVRVDQSIYRALQDLRTAPGDAVMITFTELGDTFVVVCVTAAVFLFLAAKRLWRTAAYWLAAVAGASALNTVIKLTLHRARPGELFYTGASAFSFPSGHSTTNMALYGLLAFLIARELRTSLRPLVGLAAITMVLLIAASRLYLGAHWFSDVAAGLAFGTLWLAGLIISYVRRPVPRIGPLALTGVALAALGVAGGFHIYLHHALDVHRYAVQLPAGRSMPAAQWLESGWKELPAYRIDLGGEREEPLSVQWAGSLADLATSLEAKGWTRAVPLTPLTAPAYVVPGTDAASLPVVPRFEQGQLPALEMLMPDGAGRRVVLRLWPTSLDVDGTIPVWVGSAVSERLKLELGILTLVETGDATDAARDLLTAAIPATRFVTREPPSAEWDGRVWLGMAAAP